MKTPTHNISTWTEAVYIYCILCICTEVNIKPRTTFQDTFHLTWKLNMDNWNHIPFSNLFALYNKRVLKMLVLSATLDMQCFREQFFLTWSAIPSTSCSYLSKLISVKARPYLFIMSLHLTGLSFELTIQMLSKAHIYGKTLLGEIFQKCNDSPCRSADICPVRSCSSMLSI